MKKYKIIEITIGDKDIEQKLNNLANEGWKVICSCGYENSLVILEK